MANEEDEFGDARPGTGATLVAWPPDTDLRDVLVEHDMVPGVEADAAFVSYNEQQFMLDFIRLDEPRGVGVARVFVSPLFIAQLIEGLRGCWEEYAAEPDEEPED